MDGRKLKRGTRGSGQPIRFWIGSVDHEHANVMRS
jgi:hypothetical protein